MGIIVNVMFIIGLGMLAIGLYMFEPWVCYSVIGFIVMAVAVAIGNSVERQRLYDKLKDARISTPKP